MYNIESLNEEQIIPAKNTEGAFLVTAGAGSGKTRLLTHRICYLIKEKGVNPENILAITFTNKATNEMKERIADMCDGECRVWVSTFHSMCAKILRENIWHIDGYTKFFSVYDTSDRDKVIKRILTDFKIDDSDFKNIVSHRIADAKNQGLTPQEYYKEYAGLTDADKIYNVYLKYEETLKNNNALDFDDLLMKTLQLFKQFPEVLKYYQTIFKYIHVDEFQDTNLVQYKIVKMLADLNKNIFVVGDEDQCIYGWRGANIENIFNFKKDFPNCVCYKLQQNYRSTKNILKIANTLIKNNLQRLEKTLWTNNIDGEKPKVYSAYSESDEAEYVARTINNLINNHGYSAHDIAILMRLSAFSRNFEEKLLNYNIPYVVSGIFKFFDRLEIKNILAYLRLVVNNLDNESVLRIINVPKRGIGQASIDKLLATANENGCHVYDVITNLNNYNLPKALIEKLTPLSELFIDLNKNYNELSLSDYVKYVIEKTEIKNMYNTNSEEDIDRTLNINQLIASVTAFDEKNENATLVDYLESVTLESSLEEENEDLSSVNISTIHASKGLEFKVVFVVGAEEGSFPISRAFDNSSEMEEERRLMYVAVTRAQELLYITYAQSRFLYGKREKTCVSRFLKEMDLIENKNTNVSSYYNQNYSSSFNNYYNKNYGNLMNKTSTYSESKYSANTFGSSNINSIDDDGYPEVSATPKINKPNKKFENYVVGATVKHPKFGNGIITKIENTENNTFATINFNGFGSKTLSLNFAPIELVK